MLCATLTLLLLILHGTTFPHLMTFLPSVLHLSFTPLTGLRVGQPDFLLSVLSVLF